MKVRSLAATVTLLALPLSVAFAADQKKPDAAPPGMDQAAMEMMMKAATPGPQHQHLAKMVGDWTFTNTFWMAPGAPPQQSTGTMHAQALMGGRYVEHQWSGNMMGAPFEGRGTEAYDNVSKQWETTWIDNMGTGIMNGTGTCDDAMKSCTYNNELWDPMTGKKSSMRSVITWASDNEFHNEMYGPGPDGKEMKMMEIVAKRKM